MVWNRRSIGSMGQAHRRAQVPKAVRRGNRLRGGLVDVEY
jgi:hypothetical protein